MVERMFRTLTLERGLAFGGGLLALGVLGMTAAFWHWADRSFGNLDPFQTMRLVLPSLLALGVGAEIALSSCFLGFTTFVERWRDLNDPPRG
jgi:hypothetical protein